MSFWVFTKYRSFLTKDQREQSEDLVREVRNTVEDLCLEVDQTSAVERTKLLRTVDELSRQLERITSSCSVVKDLLGKASAYDVSTLERGSAVQSGDPGRNTGST